MTLDHVSEIVPGLHMGGNFVAYEGFDLVVCLEAYPNPAKVQGFKGTFVHLPLDDGDGTFDEMAVKLIAELVAGYVVWADRKVLVHCSAGLNRAGLVVAKALMKMGETADEAIRLIRDKRDPWALCNDTFTDWLRGR